MWKKVWVLKVWLYSFIKKFIGEYVYFWGILVCVYVWRCFYIVKIFNIFFDCEFNRYGYFGLRRFKIYNCIIMFYFVIVLVRVGLCCLDWRFVRCCLYYWIYCEIEIFKVVILKEYVKFLLRFEGYCWNIFLFSLNIWKCW